MIDVMLLIDDDLFPDPSIPDKFLLPEMRAARLLEQQILRLMAVAACDSGWGELGEQRIGRRSFAVPTTDDDSVVTVTVVVRVEFTEDRSKLREHFHRGLLELIAMTQRQSEFPALAIEVELDFIACAGRLEPQEAVHATSGG